MITITPNCFIVATKEEVACDEGWTMFNNACYKFMGKNSETKYWKAASDACNQVGGNLTSIHSKEEVKFIRKLIDPPDLYSIWIGGKRNGNSFQWIDGSPFDFDNWGVKLPDNEGGNENCMEFITEREIFNDRPCDEPKSKHQKSFICKKLLIGETTTLSTSII